MGWSKNLITHYRPYIMDDNKTVFSLNWLVNRINRITNQPLHQLVTFLFKKKKIFKNLTNKRKNILKYSKSGSSGKNWKIWRAIQVVK